MPNSDTKYNISKLRADSTLIDKYKDKIFYKELRINENGLDQRLVITYSAKYQEYQKKIRNTQIERATKISKHKQNDFKRFISETPITPDGKIAKIKKYSINNSIATEESKYWKVGN